MSNLILFGAGASFGSKYVSPCPPPLGNGLFDGIMSLDKTASRMPEDIKDIFRTNFESGMAEFYKRNNGNIMSFQREMAEYLLGFRPFEENIYAELLRKIDISKFTFSSLNYDLLFEMCAMSLKIPFVYANIDTRSHLRILKIHGSSNFWPDLGGGTISGTTFGGNGRGDIAAEIVPLSPEDSLSKCQTEDSIAPAVAMFAVGKRVNVSPDFTDEQYNMWLETIASSSKIFIIGVRVHEVDSHIWDVLGKSAADIYYFGFDSDMAEFESWKSKYDNQNKTFIRSNFEDAVDFIKKNE